MVLYSDGSKVVCVVSSMVVMVATVVVSEISVVVSYVASVEDSPRVLAVFEHPIIIHRRSMHIEVKIHLFNMIKIPLIKY
jgi:hypothetical protein